MGYKRLWLVFVLMVVFPIYAFAAEPSSDFSSVHNIKSTIQNQTPEFIKQPLIKMIQSLERFRLSVELKIEKRIGKVEADIQSRSSYRSDEKIILQEELQEEENFQEYGTGLVQLFNGFKYFEIFLLTLLLYIFSYQLLFYSSIAFGLFIVTHFFWYRIY